jgi:hypothetical protein
MFGRFDFAPCAAKRFILKTLPAHIAPNNVAPAIDIAMMKLCERQVDRG